MHLEQPLHLRLVRGLQMSRTKLPTPPSRSNCIFCLNHPLSTHFWEPSKKCRNTAVTFPDQQTPLWCGSEAEQVLVPAKGSQPPAQPGSEQALLVSPALLPLHKTCKPPSSSTSNICSRSKQTTKNNYKSVWKKEKEGESDLHSAGDL